ncbi:MAG TPA: delta-60 repeat domain-containing protein, partial [Pyrinomonadaceae bacterium]|nr:delta-60 repeat domain-containing protein [Pyrinomonadaceae bacterium]
MPLVRHLARGRRASRGFVPRLARPTLALALLLSASLSALAAAGDVDPTFNPGVGVGRPGSFNALALQPDGKILAGGSFSNVDGVQRKNLARLNPDGTLDTSFRDPDLRGGVVEALAVLPDGKILVGGNFLRVGGVTREVVARLNPDGSLDETFAPTVTGELPGLAQVSSLALLPGGKIIIAGSFTTVNGVARNNIARLNADGSLDTSFLSSNSGPDDLVRGLAVQPDGKLVIHGFFFLVDGVQRGALARLNADGTLDQTFDPHPPANIEAVVVQPDGKILIGGFFNFIDTTPRQSVARLKADGSLDTTFDPGTGPNSNVLSLAVQPDGKILVGGNFTTFRGAESNGLVRLNPDGTLNNSFPSLSTRSTVSVIALEPDGDILAGGSFNSASGFSNQRLLRLNSAGGRDLSFTPLVFREVAVGAMARQPDGKVIVGGGFNNVNGVGVGSLARLNPDGSLDTTFLNGLPGVVGTVRAVALQPNGDILIGGNFIMVNGVSRRHVARLNADGSLDTAFAPDVRSIGGFVQAIVPQPDGKVIIAGSFGNVQGAVDRNVARLNADGSLDTSFLGFNEG